MGGRIRTLALLGVFVLAWCGCQKVAREETHASPDMAEAEKADSRAAVPVKSRKAEHETKTTKKTHDTAAESAGKKAASHVDTRSGVLTEADNEMEFDFREGQIITVSLDSNRASGLSWSLIQPSSGVIVPEGSPSYAVRSGKTAGGTETWRFRAAKPGHQTVKLEYRRKWASSVPERTFRFSGTVR